MGRELTKEEAEGKLEKAIKAFDWGKEFLGEDFEGFIRAYRALHAQLRDGDSLKIEIVKREHRDGPDYPAFNMVLCTLGGGRKVITDYVGYSDSSVKESWNSIVLYD